jgi:predicted ATP-binding protein involved in virulence
MILHQLNLANFRGFDQISLDFEPSVNVIAGVNGIGKSSLLRAIATGLSRVLPIVTPSNVSPLSLSDEDVAFGKSATSVSLSVEFDGHDISATVQRLLEDRPEREQLARQLEAMRAEKRRVAEPTKRQQRLEQLKLKRRLQGLRGALAESGDQFTFQIKDLRLPSNAVADDATVQQAANKVIQSLRKRPDQPVAIFYSTQRMLRGRPRTLPSIKPLTIPSAYPKALDDADVDLRDFMQWFRYHARGGKGRARAILEQLSEVVTRFVPEFKKLRIEEDPVLRLVVEKRGKPLGLHQLSDGERGLLAVIFDITRRLAIANPKENDPISQGKAVVLIDELELHLHPGWQRKVLSRLAKTFKSCQFIATTHSPQVLGESPSGSLWMLDIENGHTVRWKPDRAFGMDSNRLLEELMDTDALNAGVKEKLHDISILVDRDQPKKAKQAIDALESKLGKNHPELIRLRSLIAFVTGEE